MYNTWQSIPFPNGKIDASFLIEASLLSLWEAELIH